MLLFSERIALGWHWVNHAWLGREVALSVSEAAKKLLLTHLSQTRIFHTFTSKWGITLPMQYLWWKWWRGWWGRRSRGVEQWKWTFVGADLEETTIQKTEEEAEWWWRRRRWRSWDCNCWNTSWYPEKNITPVWEDGVNNQMLCLLCYYSYVMFYMYFQRFSVKSWLGYLSGTRVLAAWMNCLEGARRSSCGSLKVEIRSGKNHFFKTLITLWQKVTHWLNASQNDRKSKGFAFKTPGAALTIQRSAAAAEFAAAVDFVKL